MNQKQSTMAGYAIHGLTATGATLAMLAIFAAANGQWRNMFLWLLVSMVVDAVDGPLARRYDVKTHAPRIDGAILDLVIDFLTWVFIPVFALFQSGLLPGWSGWAVALIVTPASALYFSDTRMKTPDGSFHGFPGAWSMVIVAFFSLEPPTWVLLVTCAALTPAMFLPLRFVHPVRTKRWRKVTLPVAIIWTLAAGILVWGIENPLAYKALALSSIYLALAGIAQQLLPERKLA